MTQIRRIRDFLRSSFPDCFLAEERSKGHRERQDISKNLNEFSPTEDVVLSFINIIDGYVAFLKRFNLEVVKRREYGIDLQRQLDYASEKVLFGAYLIEKFMKLPDRKIIKKLFRDAVGPYIFKSKMLRRYFKKPRGYPGDYLMFEILYNNVPVSKGLGYYFDIFTMNYSLAKSVINRKNTIKKILGDFIQGRKLEGTKIMNIGCGPCREIREFFEESPDGQDLSFTFLDQDNDGLKYAAKKLKTRVNQLKTEFIQEKVGKMIGLSSGSKKIRDIGKHDFIYSLGVVDYLRDNMLLSFFDYFFQNLKKNGKLVVASCSSHVPRVYTLLTWFCDWNFYARDAQQTKQLLLEKTRIKKIDIKWEENGEIFFLIVTK